MLFPVIKAISITSGAYKWQALARMVVEAIIAVTSATTEGVETVMRVTSFMILLAFWLVVEAKKETFY